MRRENNAKFQVSEHSEKPGYVVVLIADGDDVTAIEVSPLYREVLSKLLNSEIDGRIAINIPQEGN